MLKNCLYSLREHSNDQEVKVIVVDNASRDGSSEMVQAAFPEVQLIHSGGNIGFARGNNLAIPYANTPFVLFLNPDTMVTRDSIKNLIDFMKANPSVGALGCKMKYPDGTVQNLGLQWFPSPLTELVNILFLSENTIRKFHKYLPYKNPEHSGFVSKLYGGCLMVRREIFEQIGYFDDRFFMYGEDVDLCQRILKNGWKLYYLSEAQIIHIGAGASNNSSSQFSTLMMCESILKLMEKYYGNNGKLMYRLVIFTGSQFRLLVLLFLKVLSLFGLLSVSGENLKGLYNKYLTMLKWSLKLQKPVIKN